MPGVDKDSKGKAYLASVISLGSDPIDRVTKFQRQRNRCARLTF